MEDRNYNGFDELETPDSEVENNFWESDPQEGVGWVLTAISVSLICDIGWNKSELRNRKNEKFEISECWNRSDHHFRVLEPLQSSF